MHSDGSSSCDLPLNLSLISTVNGFLMLTLTGLKLAREVFVSNSSLYLESCFDRIITTDLTGRLAFLFFSGVEIYFPLFFKEALTLFCSCVSNVNITRAPCLCSWLLPSVTNQCNVQHARFVHVLFHLILYKPWHLFFWLLQRLRSPSSARALLNATFSMLQKMNRLRRRSSLGSRQLVPLKVGNRAFLLATRNADSLFVRLGVCLFQDGFHLRNKICLLACKYSRATHRSVCLQVSPIRKFVWASRWQVQ